MPPRLSATPTQEFEETLHLHLQLPDGSVVCTQGDILEDLTTVVDTPDRRVHQISFRKGGAWDAVSHGHRVAACQADIRNVWKRRGQSTPILFPVIGRNSVFDFGISGRRAAGHRLILTAQQVDQVVRVGGPASPISPVDLRRCRDNLAFDEGDDVGVGVLVESTPNSCTGIGTRNMA